MARVRATCAPDAAAARGRAPARTTSASSFVAALAAANLALTAATVPVSAALVVFATAWRVALAVPTRPCGLAALAFDVALTRSVLRRLRLRSVCADECF